MEPLTIRLNKTIPVCLKTPWYLRPLVWLGLKKGDPKVVLHSADSIYTHPDNLEFILAFCKLQGIPYQMEKPTLRAVDDTPKK